LLLIIIGTHSSTAGILLSIVINRYRFRTITVMYSHPASCTMGTGSFPEVKYGRGVLLTTHPLLVPPSWKSRAIPLPTLWTTTGPPTGTLDLYLYCLVLSPRAIPLSRHEYHHRL